MEPTYLISTIPIVDTIFHENVTVDPGRNLTSEDLLERQGVLTLLQVSFGINKYYLWVLFVLGFPGNVAAIITISCMRSVGAFPLFVITLAVADSVALFVKLLIYQLLTHQISIGNTGCCLFRFLGSWSTAYSSWVLVMMAVERWAAVRFPLRMKLHNSCHAHKIMCFLWAACFILAVIYLPQLWTNQFVVSTTAVSCEYKPEYVQFMNVTYHWVSAAVYAFVPFCLLTVLNCMIAREIHTSLRMRNAMRNMQLMPYSHGCFDMSIQRQVNLMLLSATVVFVLFTFPICLYLIADHYWETPAYNREHAVKYFLQQLAFVLVDSTHSVNFYLYFLTARRFRYHCLRLLICRGARKWCSIKSLCKQNHSSNNQSEMVEL